MTDLDEMMDQTFMRRCIALGQQARRAGEAGVGSVLVSGGAVVAEAMEAVRARFDPAGHAEALAIIQLCGQRKSVDLSDCTLYTNIEPCVLCAYLIRRTRIARVVYGMATDQLGGATSCYALLSDATLDGWGGPPEVVGGVLADECRVAARGK